MSNKANAQQPAVVVSATNRTLLNYKVYQMTAKQTLLTALVGALAGAAVGYLFYGGIGKDLYGNATTLTHIMDAVVMVLGAVIAVRLILPARRAMLQEARRKDLRRQFIDLLDSLASSISSGKNVPDALAAARADLSVQYDEDAYIMQEVDNLLDGIRNNIDVGKLMQEFGDRSGIKDIRTFGRVFETAYIKGANLKDVVRNCHAILSSKCEIELEIETKVASSKNEQNIMLVMPVVLITMIKAGGSDFAANFTTPTGLISTTVAVGAFVGAYLLGRKILKIEV